MIRHIVLVHFASDIDKAEIAALWRDLEALRDVVPGMVHVAAGRSESPEKIERGYLHGFTVDFTGWDALAAYQEHPSHQRLGARLVTAAQGGKDGILVFDLPMNEEAP